MTDDETTLPSVGPHDAEDDPELLRRLAKNDPELQKAASRRWKDHRHRCPGDPGAPERWAFEQCGRCRYFIPLDGPMGADWGACSNNDSPFDRQVMFEHDGCDAFVDSGLDWVV